MTSRGFPSALSARTRRGFVLFWSALFILSLALQYVVFVAPAAVLAVHDEGLFELDGNAVTAHGAGLPDDWDRVYGGATTNAINSLFINDGFGAGDDIFTGGSTKDDINLPSWLWKVGSVQDKNDIENAFAVAYEKNGSTYAYFGLDRYQTSGDATAGFWFFKNGVAKTGAGSGNGSPFNGTHAEGDILVVLDYSNGGSTASAQVYYWHNGALTSLATGSECGASSNDAVCAIANTATATAPWPYDDKAAAGSSNPFPANALFEGGLNLTTLGLDTGCFSSFMAETRSSNTTSSTLSDFALGGFSFCKQPTISTSLTSGQTTGPKITVAAGSSVTDQASLAGATSTAGGTVAYTVYTDSACTTQFADAGTKSVTNGSVPPSDAVPFPNPGTYYWQAAYSGDARNLPVTSACTDETVTVPNPGIAITKDPPTQTILSGGTATWTIVVTNTGDVPLTNVNVTDPLAADCVKTFDGTLAVGASEAAYECSLTNVTADFTNVATAHGTPPVGPEVTGSDSADVHVINPGTSLVTKSVLPGTTVLAGTPVTITVTETNTGDSTLTNVHIDPSSGCTSWTPANVASLAAGASVDFSCTFTPSASTSWSATATGMDALGNPAPSAGETTGGDITVTNPGIAITKDPPTQTILSGGTATWTIVVTNTGDVPLTNVNVTDPLAADCVKTFDGTLAVGASEAAYECSLTNVTADFTNVATAHGTPPVGPEVTGSDSADVHVTPLGSLVISKTVTGVLTGFDGGDFTFSVVCSDDVTRPDVVIHVASGSVSADPITGIPAGTTCTVAETDKPAAGTYAAWDDPTYDPEGGAITIVGNQQVTVTVTNNRTYNPPQPAHLTLVKIVDNTGGGTASATDWTLTASSGGQLALSGDGGAAGDVPAGTYDLAESAGPASYTAGSWSCDGGSQEGSSVTLAEGESATCTITNTYNPPPPGPGTIIIEKQTIPSGSSQLFTFDPSWLEDGSFSLSDGQSVMFTDLEPGSYAVAETNIPAGWTLNSISGAGCTRVGDQVQIDLASGQSVHCIFTDAFKETPPPPPTGNLQIVKNVTGATEGFPGGNFYFTFSCGAVSETVSIYLQQGVLSGSVSSLAMTGLPIGTVCTVTEKTPLPDAGPNASWGTPTYDPSGGTVTIAIGPVTTVTVNNPRIVTPPTPTPSGSVEAATATPRITLPPTDSIDGTPSGGPGVNLGLILLVLAGISAVLGLMVPVPARIRRRGRRH